MRLAAFGLVLLACHSPEAAPVPNVEAASAGSAVAVPTGIDAGADAALGPTADSGARARAPEGGDDTIDSGEATRAAKAAGMKASLFVPHPVRCPAAPPAKGDPARLEAKAELTRLLVEPDGFLRQDVDVGDVISMLGPAVLCNRTPGSTYMDLHLAPRHSSVHAVTVETHDGEMIGLVVEYEPPVVVDMQRIATRYGAPRAMPGPLDSHQAGGHSFSPKNAAFSATLMFSHKDRADPLTAWQVHRILFRRTAMVEILPDRFRAVADVARLVALALRPRAPEPVGFYGTLGVYDKTVGDRITFRAGLPERNVASASIEKRARDGRDAVHAVDVTFAAPIATSKEALSRALGATASRVDAGVTTLTVRGGLVRAKLDGEKLVSIGIERDDR